MSIKINKKPIDILKSVRITEKAAILSDNNVHVFNVEKTANKRSIAKAFEEIYKVKPIKVAIVNKQSSKRIIRNIKSKVPSSKKAYIYLKKGDKVDTV